MKYLKCLKIYLSYCMESFNIESAARFAGFLCTPNSKVHGANMGPIWGRQDPDGPHVGLMNFAIWDILDYIISL